MKCLTTLVLGVTSGALAFAEGGHNLRGLKKATAVLCFNLSSNANGGFGKQTIEVDVEQRRFISRAPEVKSGNCKTNGPIPSQEDRSTRCYCRKRGGNKGKWFNFCAPKFLEEFLLNQDFIKGACSSTRNANNVKMSLVVQASGDDDTFCIDVDGDQHTVDVNYPSNLSNWFNNKADDQGQCSGGDDGSGGSKANTDLCVQIQGRGWYTVKTQKSLEVFWEDSADNVEYESCDDNNKNYEDIIEMYHSTGGSNNNIDEDILCMDIDNDEHTVEVTYPSGLRNWFNNRADEGQCSGDVNEGNKANTDLCVKIQGKWYTVETQKSLEVFWEDEIASNNFEYDSCDDNGIDDEGTIEMYHY